MPFEFIKKWKYNSSLKSSLTTRSQKKHCDIGLYTDTQDDSQIEELVKYISSSTNKQVAVLQYKNAVSKIAVPNKYFQSDIKWWGQAISTSIDQFLNHSFDKTYLFLSDVTLHKDFIVQNIQSKFIAASYVKGLEKHATFLLEADHKSILDAYFKINQTIDQLSKK
jgi:hypothetical protein